MADFRKERLEEDAEGGTVAATSEAVGMAVDAMGAVAMGMVTWVVEMWAVVVLVSSTCSPSLSKYFSPGIDEQACHAHSS